MEVIVKVRINPKAVIIGISYAIAIPVAVVMMGSISGWW